MKWSHGLPGPTRAEARGGLPVGLHNAELI